MANRYLFGGGRRRITWLFLLPGLGFTIMERPLTLYDRVLPHRCNRQRGLPFRGSDLITLSSSSKVPARGQPRCPVALAKFMVLVTVIQFGVGLLMAILVNQKLRGHLVFRTISSSQ